MITLNCLQFSFKYKNFMSTKLNFKGRHVHGLAFPLGILNPRTGKIVYRLSYSCFLFRVEYEGERRWRSEDDFYFIFAVPSWIIIIFFFNSPNWIMKFPIMAYSY